MTNRSDKYTVSDKQVEYYSDFMTNFELNPITGFLAKVSNEDSIKQSLKSLILTNRTERYYNSYIGTRIRNLLFDPMDPITANAIKDEITETIQNNEPRISIVDLQVKENQDLNQYDINLFFSIINKTSEVISLSLALKRVR